MNRADPACDTGTPARPTPAAWWRSSPRRPPMHLAGRSYPADSPRTARKRPAVGPYRRYFCSSSCATAGRRVSPPARWRM